MNTNKIILVREDAWFGWIKIFCFFLGLAALVLEFGFIRFSRENGVVSYNYPLRLNFILLVKYLAVVGFFFYFWLTIFFSGQKRYLLEAVLSTVAVAAIIFKWPLVVTVYLVFQVLILLVRYLISIFESSHNLHRTIFGLLFILIFVGAFLLSLPAASYSDRFADFGNNFSDYLFTAASAVSLTGLSVRNIAGDFTPFGQLVVLALIQLGAIGILSLGSLIFQVSIKKVIMLTLLFEAAGAVLLFNLWQDSAPGEKIFKSCFHSVSAFCNTSFSLGPDNLIGYAGSWQVYLVILPLIIIGGLGAPVWLNLLSFEKLTNHTKIVLASTFVLIIAGTILIFAVENPAYSPRWGRDVQYEDIAIKTDQDVLRNHDKPQRVLDSLFLSVSARTSGMRTVDMTTGKLAPATLVILALLMFIGGSPASTAGGVKTVTFFVLASTAISILKKPDAKLPDYLRMPLLLFMLLAAVTWCLTLGLAITHPQINFLDLLFEAVSACTCTGFSTGITVNMNLTGRVLLMLGMIVGRLGPLAMLFYLMDKQAKN